MFLKQLVYNINTFIVNTLTLTQAPRLKVI